MGDRRDHTDERGHTEETVRAALDAVTPDGWAELRRLTDDLSNAGGSAEWSHPAPAIELRDEVDVHEFGFPVYAKEVADVVDALARLGLIISFDWDGWHDKDRYLDGDPIDDPIDAAKLLTTIVQAEAMSAGAIDRAIANGAFGRALQALQSGDGT